MSFYRSTDQYKKKWEGFKYPRHSGLSIIWRWESLGWPQSWIWWEVEWISTYSPFEWTALHSPKMSLHFCLISQCLMGRNEKGCKMDVNERQKRRPSTGWKSAVGSTLTKKSAVSSTVDVNHWPTKIENNEIFLVFKIFNFFGTFGIRACFESL